MKTKTTRKYDGKPIRMVKTQTTDSIKGWSGCRATRILIPCWWE
jgi:hypothetical protein